MRTVAVVGEDETLVRSLVDAASATRDTVVLTDRGRTSDAVDHLLAEHPDVMVIDEQAWSHEVARVMERRNGARVVVVVSGMDATAVLALTSGASGVVMEATAREDLSVVLDVVGLGLCVMPPGVLHLLLAEDAGVDLGGEARIDRLTPREREVLAHLMAGEGHREIAESLLLSVHTVRFHMKHILAKLAVNSGLEAAMLGARAGVLPARGRPREGQDGHPGDRRASAAGG